MARIGVDADSDLAHTVETTTANAIEVVETRVSMCLSDLDDWLASDCVGVATRGEVASGRKSTCVE